MRLYLSTIDPNAEVTARKYGLGLEIAEYCTAWNMDLKFAETDPSVRKKLEGIDKRVLHGPFNELFPCAIDPMIREVAKTRFRQAIALAESYGIQKIVIHGGYNPWLYYPIWYKEQSVLFWKEFIDEVPENMVIVLENVLEETPDMLLDIIRAADDPRLQICLDIGHVNAYSEVPVMEWLHVCGPWIRHFHIHNNFGIKDTHSPLEEGSIPMTEFLKEALYACPQATFTLELTDAEPSVTWLIKQLGKKYDLLAE